MKRDYEALLKENERYWSGTCALCGLTRIECQKRLDDPNTREEEDGKLAENN